MPTTETLENDGRIRRTDYFRSTLHMEAFAQMDRVRQEVDRFMVLLRDNSPKSVRNDLEQVVSDAMGGLQKSLQLCWQHLDNAPIAEGQPPWKVERKKVKRKKRKGTSGREEEEVTYEDIDENQEDL